MRFFTGSVITDNQSGFRAYSRASLDRITFNIHDMGWAIDTCLQIIRKKIRFKEVPISVRYTDYSIAKGQKLGNMIMIIIDLLTDLIFKQ
jgi:polyprenyl-phospho-N-acetylgalactosaminyl synthase